MIIPHGNNVVRVYVQILLSSPDQDYWKAAPESKVKKVANEILSPYYIEWERVDWYSVYPIGQGIAERYSLDERVFIGGDACHTHSVCCPALSLAIPESKLADLIVAKGRARDEFWILGRAEFCLEVSLSRVWLCETVNVENI